MPAVHLCIVSSQLVPNLLPVLLPEIRPAACILLTSPAMTSQARRLAALLEVRGVQPRITPLDDADPNAAFDQLADLAPTLQDAAVTVNITGGTKPMALVAYEFAREIAARVLYVDTDRRQLVQLAPIRQVTSLPDALTVADALACAGYTIERRNQQPVPLHLRDLAENLARGMRRLHGAMPAVNRLACVAREELRAPLEGRDLRNHALRECLTLFEAAGLCAVANNTVFFVDEEARQVANGGWLELYVASVAHRLRANGHMFDWCCNTEITSERDVRNEIDLAFTSHNKLHLVECKTQHPAAMTKKDDAPHYKIKTLRDHIGGVMSKAMLCSALLLRPADRNRLAEYKIEVVEGPDLAHLERHFIQWIDK